MDSSIIQLLSATSLILLGPQIITNVVWEHLQAGSCVLFAFPLFFENILTFCCSKIFQPSGPSSDSFYGEMVSRDEDLGARDAHCYC